MPDMLKDGKGRGFLAEVDGDNTLKVTSRNLTFAHAINHNEGNAFLVFSDVIPTAANDVFMYMKNTSSKDLIISWYRMWTPAGSSEAIDIFFNKTGTPAGTTVITPTNMNLGSGNVAVGDFFEGVDITGLSGGNIADRIRIIGGEDVIASWAGDIIVTPNKVVTFQAVVGAIPVELTVGFYFDGKNN